jgi:DNA-binding NarL/FixJ family response regulator
MQVLIVDDHPLIREGLARVTRGLDGISEVFEAADATAAMAALERVEFGLILLDLGVPGADGLSLLETLRGARPEVPVVIVSASDGRAEVFGALDAGAMGFISKRSSTSMLLAALKVVLAGGVSVPPHVAEQPDDALAAHASTVDADAAAASAAAITRLGLTDRQVDVLTLMVQGMPNKAICRDLGLSEGTVKTHISAILRALEVANRTQALFAVSRLGLRLAVPVAQPRTATV